MIRCLNCKQEKAPEEFYRDSTRRNGRDTWCKVCCNSRYREYTKQIRDWKEAQPCTDCGQFFPHYVLQLDHTQGNPYPSKCTHDKVSTVASLLRVMEKEHLELVCANCHCVRTYERRVQAAA